MKSGKETGTTDCATMLHKTLIIMGICHSQPQRTKSIMEIFTVLRSSSDRSTRSALSPMAVHAMHQRGERRKTWNSERLTYSQCCVRVTRRLVESCRSIS